MTFTEDEKRTFNGALILAAVLLALCLFLFWMYTKGEIVSLEENIAKKTEEIGALEEELKEE